MSIEDALKDFCFQVNDKGSEFPSLAHPYCRHCYIGSETRSFGSISIT